MRTFDGTTAVSYVSTHLWSSSNMTSNCLRLVCTKLQRAEAQNQKARFGQRKRTGAHAREPIKYVQLSASKTPTHAVCLLAPS